MLSPRMRARNSVSAISLRKTHKNRSHFTARHHSSGFWRAFPPPVRTERGGGESSSCKLATGDY